MKKADNRRFPRVKAQHFVSYHRYDAQGNVVYEGMALSLDLSREGILIQERQEIPVQTRVKIILAVGDDVVPLLGTVKHVEKVSEDLYRMGIHFDQITEEQVQKIAQYHPDILKNS